MWDFPRSYYINLDTAVERRKKMTELFHNLNINCERKKAVVGKNVNPKSLPHIFSKPKMSPSEIGIFLSHYELWSQLKNDPDNNCYIIFEDDIVTYGSSENLKKEIIDAISTVSRIGGDILYLGKCGDICSNYEKISDSHIYKTTHPLCLHAYVIFKKAVDKILAHAPFNKPIDVELLNMYKQGILTACTFHPSLFFQDILDTGSTLRTGVNLFYNIEECIDHRLFNTSLVEGFDTVPLLMHKVKIPIWIIFVTLILCIILFYVVYTIWRIYKT